MAFLILTRAGFDDLAANTDLAGASLHVNPALLSDAETARLRQAGADVRLLPVAVDPHAPPQVSEAVRRIREEGGGTVWVEGVPAETPPAVQAPSAPAASDSAVEPAHRRLARTAGALAGQALRGIGRRLAADRGFVILPYLGYGNPQRLFVRGRVVQDEGFQIQGPADSRWRNLVELMKRLESDQVAGARVRARFQGAQQDAVTDAGGYFSFDIVPPAPLASSGWHAVELELVDPSPRGAPPVRATASALVPPSSARFGIISDIDDTVLWTNVTNKLNMLRMLAHSNAHTRKPFKGVAAFYRALRDGAGGDEGNPVFYVSSSPWHLFGPLVEFLTLQDIPLGPLLLKELGVRQVIGAGKHHTHKLDKIESILRLYPDMPFVLIGDSGEQDPEIYAEVVRRHPRTVRVIYIRNVNPDPARIDALDRLIDEVRSTGTQLILSPDSEFAAAHAAAEGLIRTAGIAAVRSDKQDEERS